MKKIVLSLFLLWSCVCKASLNIRLDPKNPVTNESFSLIFTVESSKDKTPDISFNPSRAKILEKRNEGVSIQTTIINGKMSTKRQVVYAYDLETDKAGTLVLRDIRVKVGRETLTHPNIRVNIRSKGYGPKDIFLLGIPSKTALYLGEGFDLNYYLYYRVPIVNNVVHTFPKIRYFLNRSPEMRAAEETIEHKGVIYKRSLLHSYRLYPEKTGTVKIEPYIMEVTYVKNRQGRGSPFGIIQSNMGRQVTKKIRSKRISVEVFPLPTENLPKQFTGLVGDHEFKLTMNKNKYLVNEVIEARLEVTGPGALENMSPPKLYDHHNLEDFDTKINIEKISRHRLKKTFDYTFLARGRVHIPESEILLYIFDTKSEQYIEKKLFLPPLSVYGPEQKAPDESPPKDVIGNKDDEVRDRNMPSLNLPKQRRTSLVAPVFSLGAKIWLFPWVDFLNILLGIAILYMSICPLVAKYISRSRGFEDWVMDKFKKGKFEYSDVYKFLSLLRKKGDESDIKTVVGNSSLSKGSKQYFIDILDKTSCGEYGNKKEKVIALVKKKGQHLQYFREVYRIIKNGSS